ncbi:MAG: SEC-C domain-containing protein, partial [Candidatus Eremiobacteraeota bacterium]|nr:SEC-C domain-containing protein [Candidatus Eremiobacteraeota bacterium]
EAQIIKDAGLYGAVTIATNMAGRGVDIKLGDGVPDAGGLHIIGTERHESRRIDNQLRGRSGRQGDKGSTRFYASLEDEVMRLFGGERLTAIMDRVGFSDETPIEAKMISASMERAQSKVENHNYEIRKSVLEYDDVMNKQREVIYGDRRAILRNEFPTRDFLIQTLEDKVDYAVDSNAPENVHPSEWDLAEILNEIELIFPVKNTMSVEDLEKLDRNEMKTRLRELAIAAYDAKEAEVTPELMRVIEAQYIMLPIIDRLWVDHLYVMDALKTGIGLRGYGQKDPRVEYEKEAYEIFEDLKNNIADEAIKSVFRIVIDRGDGAAPLGAMPAMAAPQLLQSANFGNAAPAQAGEDEGVATIPSGSLAPQPSRIAPEFAEKLLGPAPGGNGKRELHTNRDEESVRKPTRASAKVGRNDLCPCGSGKKYKRCHGVTA